MEGSRRQDTGTLNNIYLQMEGRLQVSRPLREGGGGGRKGGWEVREGGEGGREGGREGERGGERRGEEREGGREGGRAPEQSSGSLLPFSPPSLPLILFKTL